MRLGSVCPCPRTHEDIAASMEVRQLAGRAANAEELQFQPLPRRRRREVAATGGERDQTTGGSRADDRSGGSFQHAVYLENARSVLGTSAVRQPAPVPPPRDPTAWVVEYATAAYAGAADLRTLRENAASASVHSLQERAVKQLWACPELSCHNAFHGDGVHNTYTFFLHLRLFFSYPGEGHKFLYPRVVLIIDRTWMLTK